MDKKKITKIIAGLKQGQLAILPTDTLYGLVGLAQDKKVLQKIKKLKNRSAGKPFIILISSLKDLEKFKVKINKKTEDFLKTIWPGPVSVALTNHLSFRWPRQQGLVEIVKKTGPLVAPSANPEGLKPAETITEAKQYFSDKVDFYLSANKRLTGRPSTLIKIKADKIEVLRQGRVRLPLSKIIK